MSNLPIKPIWIVTLGLLCTLVAAVKLALAYSAFTPSTQPVGYVAQDDMSNYNLTGGGETLYRTQYEREFWSGTLLGYPMSSTGNFSVGSPTDAGDQLDSRPGARVIVTMTETGTRVPFSWGTPGLSAAQKANLGNDSTLLDFLRGDRSKEIGAIPIPGSFRQRGSAMGDVVHSRPYYLSDDTSTTPKPTVFVGANDGMLHAFDAVTGDERWAYVPSMLFPKLKALSASPYVHDYYVDGTVNVANIGFGTSSKRVLVGALGAGGKGLYALDITGSARLAPADEPAAATNILWEITPTAINYVNSSSYANLGYTYSNPTIAKVNGTDVVIVGNGYNGADGKAYLYIINANNGARMSVFSTDSSTGNGLSTPVAIDTNHDGNIDTVYAGDLNGTMWKFDLSASTLPTSGIGTVLLTTNPAQPITMTPGVAVHPNGGYMIDFATGAMLSSSDLTDSSVFYAYGIWDGAPSANLTLSPQTITERCYTATTPCTSRVRTVTSAQPDWTAGSTHHKGWRVALPAGEKVVGDGSFIENGRFYFNGYNPTVSTVPAGTTQAVAGENWLMELDYLTGGSKNMTFLDLNADQKLTDADRVQSAGSPVMTTDGIPVGKFISIGVMSQPILVQLTTLNDTLFNQNPDVVIPALVVERGVAGGHFDVDNYFGSDFVNCPTTTTTTRNGRTTTQTNNCGFVTHLHEYDDIYDVTGVNFLNTSSVDHDLSKAITSSTKFKVLVQNQYLSPAVKLHIGNPAYVFNIDAGYIALKDYYTAPSWTAATLLGTGGLPTYTLANIGSFAVNMPVNAFDQKDWWGGALGLPADVRVGLHPTYPDCVYTANGKGDGNMYKPVNPPLSVTADGQGTWGYNSSDTNNSRATGVRHNGALTIQVIKDTTPARDIQLVVPNHPEYGWRVMSAKFSTDVLAEYNIYWHYHKGMGEVCYGDTGWTKLADKDTRACGSVDSATTTKCAKNQSPANGTDPKIGTLGSAGGGSGAVKSTKVNPIANGTRTVIVYDDGYTITIDKTVDSAGTTTVHTTDSTNTVNTTETIITTAGANKSGGDERGLQSRTGRISWRELVSP